MYYENVRDLVLKCSNFSLSVNEQSENNLFGPCDFVGFVQEKNWACLNLVFARFFVSFSIQFKVICQKEGKLRSPITKMQMARENFKYNVSKSVSNFPAEQTVYHLIHFN